MRIAVSSEDARGLDSAVHPHFGRCPFFVLVDLEGKDVKRVRTIGNPFYGQHQPGVVPGFVHEQGANVMITGGMGGRAIGFFEESGIQAVTGASGTVREAVQRFLAGELEGTAPCNESVEHGHGEAPAEDR